MLKNKQKKEDERTMYRKTFVFDGKRYDVTSSDPEELIAKIALKKKDLEEGRIILDRNTLVRDWKQEYFKTYVSKDELDRGYKDKDSLYKNYIDPEIGHMRIRMVRQLHCQNIMNRAGGLSKSRVLKLRQLLTNLFRMAMENHLILENPTNSIKLPPCRDGSNRSITAKERKFTLQVAEYHKSGLYILLMLYLGLRPGEVAALQWRNVDLSSRYIKIDSARKGEGIGAPKSDAGYRSIPVPDKLLDRLKEESKGKGPFNFVLENNGHMYTKAAMYRLWRSFVREMNIVMGCKVYRNQLQKPYPVANDLIAYCYRHTYCTDLQAAGVAINVARELMGHSDIETTSQIYTHHSDRSIETAAKLINEYHNGKKKKVSNPKFRQPKRRLRII